MEYANIEIKESNLDWIEDNNAQELPPTLIEIDDDKTSKNMSVSVDMGPSESQTLSGFQEDLHVACEIDTVLGVLPSSAPHLPKEKDEDVVETLNSGLNQHNKRNHTTIQFPYASPEPVNEYDQDSSLFTRAFPWLFPGGLGDFGQFRNKKINVGDWTRNLLYHKDGRFAKDRICFFCIGFCSQKKIR